MLKSSWRNTSYNTIATELDKFSERHTPFIGIRNAVSGLS